MRTDRIDGVLIESEEDGFWMILSGHEAEYRFHVHGIARELLSAVQAEIGTWLAEGQAMAREHEAERRWTDEEAEGYERSDPKHPDWHSVHADHYDNREKV